MDSTPRGGRTTHPSVALLNHVILSLFAELSLKLIRRQQTSNLPVCVLLVWAISPNSPGVTVAGDGIHRDEKHSRFFRDRDVTVGLSAAFSGLNSDLIVMYREVGLQK